MRRLALLLGLTAACFAQQPSENWIIIGNPAQPVQQVHATTIKEAILRAGPNGTVWIPANYTGTDCNPLSSCTPGTTLIIDLRGGIFAPFPGISATVGDNSVTNVKLAPMAANSLKGNNTGGSANAADLTIAQVKALLALAPADISGLGLQATRGELSGAVTTSGSNVTTLATNGTTNANLAQGPANSFKGNPTGSTANVTDMTPAQSLVLQGQPTIVNANTCPGLTDACFAGLFTSANPIRITGSGTTFRMSSNAGLVISDYQGGGFSCEPGIKFRPLVTGGAAQVVLINGGTGQLKKLQNFGEGCDFGGDEFSTANGNGTISVTAGSTTATLTSAPTANQITAMTKSGNDSASICVYGTISGDPNPAHEFCQKQIATIVTTAVTLSSAWGGLSCSGGTPLSNGYSPLNGATSCPYRIVFGAQYGVKITDTVYNISAGSLVGASPTATLTIPSSQSAQLTTGEFITLGVTGSIGSGTSRRSFNGQQGPITVSSGCNGTAVACVFTFPANITGTATLTGNSAVFVGPQHITVNNAEIGDITQQGFAAASDSNDPQELVQDIVIANSRVHDCGTTCIEASRVSNIKQLNNTVWDVGIYGGSGSGIDISQSEGAIRAGNEVAYNTSAGGAGYHAVFDVGMTESSNRVHDVQVGTSLSNNINFYWDTIIGASVTGAEVEQFGLDYLGGFTKTGSLGTRIEVSQNFAFNAPSINNTGGSGILLNSRSEAQNGACGGFCATYDGTNSSLNTAGTETCVINPATQQCGVSGKSFGKQLHSFDTLGAINNGQTIITAGSGSSTAYQNLAIKAQDDTTLSGTSTPFDGVLDTSGGGHIEGSGALEICNNAGGAFNSCAAPTAVVWNSGCATPAACTVAQITIQCATANAMCNGTNGAINYLTLPVHRIWIQSATEIKPGDFVMGYSSLANCAAPEGYFAIPDIKATNTFVLVEMIARNFPKFIDVPGVMTFCFMTKPGGTTGTYSKVWLDDLHTDIPSRFANNSISGGSIAHTGGAGIIVCGGTSGFNIGGGLTINSPGWGTDYTGLGAHSGIEVRDGISGSTCTRGYPFQNGMISGVRGHNDLSQDTASVGINFVQENTGSHDSITVDYSGFSPLEWNTPFAPGTATNFAPTIPLTFSGSCTGVATASSTLFLSGLGATGGTFTCTVTASNQNLPVPRAGTITNLQCKATAGGVGAGSGVVTVVKDGSNQATTCTFNTATSCSDTAHSFSVVANDVLRIQFTSAVAETLAGVNCTVNEF